MLFDAHTAALRLDDAESLYFQEQVESIRAKVYETRYAELEHRRLIPLGQGVAPWAQNFTYKVYDAVGMAKIIANHADDIPRVDVRGRQVTMPVRDAADAYGWTRNEIRLAAASGVDLDSRKANAARRALSQLEQDIAFNGDSDHGLVGLLNHPNISVVSLPADGTGSSALWSTKTAPQIVRDLNKMVDAIINVTKGYDRPNTVLLSQTSYTAAATTLYANTTTSALEMFQKTHPGIRVEITQAMAGIGGSGTDSVLVYMRSPDALELITPQDFEQEPEQPRNLEVVINCTMRIAGVAVYLPLSIARANGI